MKLSVIIPTYNRSEYLEKCLASITQQTLSGELFEVIVVDNNSSDETRMVVENFKNRIQNLKYVFEVKPGLHSGRHRGMKESISDILVYADDDIEAFPTWLEGIHESFNEDSVVLVGGKNIPKWESEPPYWIYEMWMDLCEYGHALGHLSILDFGDNIMEVDPGYVWGCNFSIRKNVLLEAGGFHPDSFPQSMVMYRGDGETHVSNYIRKKGYKALYNPKASVFHFVTKGRMTIDYFCKRSFNQGISNSYSSIREKNNK